LGEVKEVKGTRWRSSRMLSGNIGLEQLQDKKNSRSLKDGNKEGGGGVKLKKKRANAQGTQRKNNSKATETKGAESKNMWCLMGWAGSVP